MALTETAIRMLGTLPLYEQDEPFLQRIMQARANEVDRADALLDQLAIELIPGQATDAHGLLGIWERVLQLPIEPPDATENQRRAKVRAALQKLDAASAADMLTALEAAVGGAGIIVLRDTPSALHDTLESPFASGTYNAVVLFYLAQRGWPAHRSLVIHFSDGFLLDASPLDISSL